MRRTPSGRDQYLATIEDYVGQRRLSPMLLSPKEWTVAERWRRDEIPLLVVFRGIDRAMRTMLLRANEFHKLRISLSYCDKPVRAAFKSYLKAQSLFFDEKRKVGGSELYAMPEDSDTYYVLNRLNSLAKQVDELAADGRFALKRADLEQLAAEVRSILSETQKSRKGDWLERIQTNLAGLDRELLELGKGCIPEDRLGQLEAEVLQAAKELNSPSDQMLLDYLLDKAVREELDLITIGLFDI